MTRRLAPLLDFVPKASPRFVRPSHLAPVAALLERSESESVRGVLSLPPRHAKTELIKHFVARRLLARPELRVIYSSYSQRFAEKKSREIRALYKRLGGKLANDAASRADWRTGIDEGGVWATSVGGSVTGEGGDLIIVDDPHKGRAEAESAIEREKVHEWHRDDLETRAEPDASVFVIQTRWVVDDLAGHLVAGGEYEGVALPALSENGVALWPERFSAEKLMKIRDRIGEYSWQSLYQQSPRPRSGALFEGVTFYDALPEAFRIGKGCDLAYSAKTRSDSSAGVVGLMHDSIFYVTDVRTAQVKVPDFLAMLSTVDARYPGAWHWYTSSTEAGVADLSALASGVTVTAHRATVDKYMRAQPVAAAWKAGRVRLPRSAPWLDRFVAEVCGFVGIGDRHDDQVDALASAFDSVNSIDADRVLDLPRPVVTEPWGPSLFD